MESRQQTRRASRTARKWSLLFVLGTALIALSMILSSCAPSPQQQASQQSKAKLDNELHHAKDDLGIPDSLLKPIETQEQQIASGNSSAQDATANYNLLYSQLLGIEQTAAQTLKTQAVTDLQAFTTILNTRRSQGFTEINTYQARLDQALKDLNSATTAGDFAQLDAFVRQQSEALNALWPAYLKLQDFKATLHAVRLAGVNSSLSDSEYNADLQAFRDASSADRYQALVGVIDGQIMQLLADQTEALPFIGATMLSIFQSRIDQLNRWGEHSAAKTFQAQHDSDATDLASAKGLADYLTLAQLITKQSNAMVLPWARGQARDDLRQLQEQVNIAMARNPLVAYEYADSNVGIGNVQGEFNSAYDVNSYMQADADTRALLINLRAQQDNLNDPTVAWQPHKVDFQLMQTYGIMSGKVIIVSLAEQVARFYENGALVYWTYVTTGRYEKPTTPGSYYAMQKASPMEFKSSEPKSSPFWYAPTLINYAILFANYGFYLHDAWWRLRFGPGTNMPHYDPLAFNSGSHGCVNFPEDNMAWVYAWTPIGTPVEVY